MDAVTKRIVRKSAFLFLMLTVSVAGIHRVMMRTADLPAVRITAAERTPVIVLDAGHGGIDGGCSTAEGVPEKGINLAVMLGLRELLTLSGYEVRVTRDSDRSVHDKGVEGIAAQKSSDMDNRLAMMNAPENAVCLSIHQNQFTDPKYSGAQMFYADTNDRSESLAEALQSAFRTQLQPENTREIKHCGKELFLCYFCKHPTVMAECGFLSNPEEAACLTDPDYQKQVAFTLFAGLTGWLAGQEQHVESFVGLDEGIDHTDRVGRMDVIVHVAMNQHKVALEVLCELLVGVDVIDEGGVTLVDLLEDSMVLFTPPAVVDAVVMVSGAGNRHLEEVRILEDGCGAHESST